MRVALGIQYDGSGFRGWQAQPSGTRTVQTVLEQALAKVANHPIRLVCAGRTDTGCMALAKSRISIPQQYVRSGPGCWAATPIYRWMSV